MNDHADVWAVRLLAPGAAPEVVYVLAPSDTEAERFAWAKLERITGKACSGHRWSLVSIVRGVHTKGMRRV